MRYKKNIKIKSWLFIKYRPMHKDFAAKQLGIEGAKLASAPAKPHRHMTQGVFTCHSTTVAATVFTAYHQSLCKHSNGQLGPFCSWWKLAFQRAFTVSVLAATVHCPHSYVLTLFLHAFPRCERLRKCTSINSSLIHETPENGIWRVKWRGMERK